MTLTGAQSSFRQQFVRVGGALDLGSGTPISGGGTGSGSGSGSGSNGGGGTSPTDEGTGVAPQLQSIGNNRYRITNFAQAWKTDLASGNIVDRFVDPFSNAYYVIGFDYYVAATPETPTEPAQPGHWNQAIEGMFLGADAPIGIDAIVDRTTDQNILLITLFWTSDYNATGRQVQTGWGTTYERRAGAAGNDLSVLSMEGNTVLIDLPAMPTASGTFGHVTLTAQTNAANAGGNTFGYISRTGTKVIMQGSLTPIAGN